MKIIVTGVSGFVGGHVARYLAKKGHQITGLSRRAIPDIGIKHIKIDLAKAVAKKLPYKSYDALIHCAALTELNAAYDHAYSANVLGTKHAFILAKKYNVKKFIHISSFSVYKEFTDRKMVKETFPKTTSKGSTYSVTKLMAEEFLRQQTGITTICLRPHVIYGPGDMTVLYQFLKKLRFNKLVLPIDTPKEVSVTYVLNLVDGINFFLNKKLNTGFHVYNISDKEVIDSTALIKGFLQFAAPKTSIRLIPKEVGYFVAHMATLIAIFQRKNPEITIDLINQLNNNSSLSIKKLKDLGFEPKYTYDQGLEATKIWFEKFDGIDQFTKYSNKVWPKVI